MLESETQFAATSDVEENAIRALVDQCHGNRSFPVPPKAFHLANTLPQLPVDAPNSIAHSEKEALLQAACDAAFASDDHVTKVRAIYQDQVRRILVLPSTRSAMLDATSLTGLRLDVTIQKGGHIEKGYALAGTTTGFGQFLMHQPEQIAYEAVQNALRRFERMPSPTGSMPIVFAPGWGGLWLHEVIGHMLEADMIYQKAAPFYNAFGTPVAPRGMTLWDDGTRPGGRASSYIDDEGIPSQATCLIDDGTLNACLTDRRHAALLGLPCTGNGRRQDYRFPPSPRMTNLLLDAHTVQAEDLIADIPKGLYVEQVRHGTLLPESGRFTLEILEGRRIEHGQRTAPVSDVRIEGFISDVLHNIRGIGNDFRLDTARGQCEKIGQVVPISVGQPTVRIDSLLVYPDT